MNHEVLIDLTDGGCDPMPFQAFPAGRSGHTERFERQQLLPSATGVLRLAALLAAIAGPAPAPGVARSGSMLGPRWVPAFGG